MRPVLRRLHSPDVEELRTFEPPDPAFAILVQLLVGPSEAPGEESFDLVVCSPEWLRAQGRPIIGRHHLIVPNFNYDDLLSLVENYLERSTGSDWKEVACKVGRLGRWEFEDYDETMA